jgi:hypothetical protein
MPIHTTTTALCVLALGVATAAISSPIVISPAPPTSSRLRPNMSPITPKVNSNNVKGITIAAEIQLSCEAVVPRSC